ncbi:MAG: helix-turn-helix domain-containing protein [Streptomycetaceae bacterium]|nr:helix-turn-helix domain-containing protein [Streptomycetaceae bacterium]
MAGGTRDVGTLLREERILAGLTQEQLADRSGISERTIRNLERGVSGPPRQKSVELLADALALPTDRRERLRFVLRAPCHTTEPATQSVDEHSSSYMIPRQLPAAIPHFVGREEAITELEALTGQMYRSASVAVISGSAGVGKTSLVVHWAYQVAGGFPDGQLYADLRGFGPGKAPVVPMEAIRSFLGALGVPPDRLPRSLEERTAMYRSLVAEKRLLVVLDNVRDAEQVRPLLPGGVNCLTVVTSRQKLTGLVAAEGARPLVLDVFSMEEARALMDLRLGPETGVRRGAVDEVIGLCARLPLALNVVAARVSGGDDSSLEEMITQLRDEDPEGRLDALGVGDEATDVRAVLSWSYRQLGANSARMFRLLGLHPYIGSAAAANLAGIPYDRARAALAELVQAGMLRYDSGRYSCHDLLRAYAAGRAACEQT